MKYNFLKLDKATRDKALGFFFILMVATIWVTASFIVKEIVTGGMPPFILTYICNSLFVIYLPIVEFGRYGKKAIKGQLNSSAASNAQIEGETRHLVDIVPRSGSAEDLGETSGESDGLPLTSSADAVVPYTRWETAKAAMWISPVWFLAQFTFNTSLQYTSVTSNTILSSLASLFTFLLSVIFLKESFTAQKAVGILLCMIGTALVAEADKNSGHDTWGGDLLCLASAAFYAVYTVTLRKVLPHDERVSTALFFGYVGLINGIMLAPVVLIGNATKLMHLAAIPGDTYLLTIVKGLIDNVLSDYLWARSVLLVGPTIASVGLGIQIPMAIMVELMVGTASWVHVALGAVLMIGGAVCVTVGFIAVSLEPVQVKPVAGSESQTQPAHVIEGQNIYSSIEDLQRAAQQST